jgi:thioredoxin 1
MTITHLADQEIYDEIKNSDLLLIDCWAPWCGSCRMIAGVLEDIHQETNMKISKVNADENEEFIGKFQVLGLPTLLLFQKGQLVKRMSGYQPKELLMDELKEWI